MHAHREEPSRPEWSSDALDAGFPPEIEAAYYDSALEAWVLSRHADVLAAFRASGLAPAGPHSRYTSDLAEPDHGGRLAMREETLQALSPANLRSWRERLMPEAQAMASGLATGKAVDLIGDYARPLCLSLAAMVTDIPIDEAETLRATAQPISASAAEPYDPQLRARAKTANAELRECLHSGPEALRDSGFVALAHTMPCLLANAWFALLQHPRQWQLLHQQPELTEQAMEELLRYAGLTRILFRRATEDVELNGVHIRKGERIVLRIIAANRDPDRFACPHAVDITRRDLGQLALGAGAHSCVGASLIRMAAIALTQPLLQRFAAATFAQPVAWQGGAGFRSPAALWTRLS